MHIVIIQDILNMVLRNTAFLMLCNDIFFFLIEKASEIIITICKINKDNRRFYMHFFFRISFFLLGVFNF